MISLSPKGGTRASECIECSEKFLFSIQRVGKRFVLEFFLVKGKRKLILQWQLHSLSFISVFHI